MRCTEQRGHGLCAVTREQREGAGGVHALHRQVGLFPPGGFLRHWGRYGAGEGPLAGCVSESQCVLQDALSMQSPEASLLEVCLLSPEAMCTAQGTPLTPSSCGGHVTPGTLLKGRPGWGWTWPGRHWAPQGGQEAGPGGGGGWAQEVGRLGAQEGRGWAPHLQEVPLPDS